MAKTLIALLFATLPFVVDATSQLVIASASCSNGLTLDGIHSDCGGECVFGGKVDLSGLGRLYTCLSQSFCLVSKRVSFVNLP